MPNYVLAGHRASRQFDESFVPSTRQRQDLFRRNQSIESHPFLEGKGLSRVTSLQRQALTWLWNWKSNCLNEIAFQIPSERPTAYGQGCPEVCLPGAHVAHQVSHASLAPDSEYLGSNDLRDDRSHSRVSV